MSVLNISQIMEILPHRQPMLLIDSVEEIEYGVRADILTLETEIIKVKGPIGVGKATAKVGDEIACIAELTFAVE